MPAWLQTLLPPATGAAWPKVAAAAPAAAYLAGGTAVAVHLRHRESRDLDVFLAQDVDLASIRDELAGSGDLVVEHFDPTPGHQTFNCHLDGAKVQFLGATDLAMVEECDVVAGLRIASLRDLLAMKLKAVGDRGELRDYADLNEMETSGGLTVEEGIALAVEKYRPGDELAFADRIVRALGYHSDVLDDPGLPEGLRREPVVAYWTRRFAEIVRNMRAP